MRPLQRRASDHRRGQRRRIVAVLAYVVLALSPGCQRETGYPSGIVATLEIAAQPVRPGPARLIFCLKDASAKPVTGANVILEGNMSHPGMAPAFAQAEEVAPGRYRAVLEFGMAGDWIILAHITLKNGQKVERQMDILEVKAS